MIIKANGYPKEIIARCNKMENKRLVTFKELKRGTRLWDNKDEKWQEVFHVFLWAGILEENPGRYFVMSK